MATRTLNRRALRDQNDAAEADEAEEEVDADEGAEDEDGPKPRARKKSSRVQGTDQTEEPGQTPCKKKTVKAPERTVARWAVCDNGAKRLAVFEYKDRAGADAKLAEVRERKAGTYYLVLVKDPYDPPAELAAPASST